MANRSRPAYAAISIACLVLGLAVWLCWPRTKVPSSVQGSAMATPAKQETVVSNPPAPTPAADAAATRPKTTPQVLPLSNAFTTLDDYRRRHAAAPQTPMPFVPPPAGRTPDTELGHVTFMVRDFRAAFGSNPVGSNKEITRALMGNNARNVKFLDPATAALDAKGELLDAWGHPYFFHALSGTVMEIRSAGPDGKIFTDDDLLR